MRRSLGMNEVGALFYFAIFVVATPARSMRERAAYGQQVVASVAESLVAQYGKSFVARNLRRMMQFAEVFSDLEIVVPLARQLNWSHFTTQLAEQKRLEKS